jgi:hypothetical protein
MLIEKWTYGRDIGAIIVNSGAYRSECAQGAGQQGRSNLAPFIRALPVGLSSWTAGCD